MTPRVVLRADVPNDLHSIVDFLDQWSSTASLAWKPVPVTVTSALGGVVAGLDARVLLTVKVFWLRRPLVFPRTAIVYTPVVAVGTVKLV